jgi:hypothetical protein
MTRTLLIVCLVTAFVVFSRSPGQASPTPGINPVTREEVRVMVVQEALRSEQVPPSLALAVAHAESHFDPTAESSAGARGVMQIMPATGKGEFGVDPDELWQPRLNIQLGITFLGDLIDRYDGRWDLALSYYNGGSRVGSGASAKVIPVTQSYVDKVLKLERRYADDAKTERMIADARTANPTLSDSVSREGRALALQALRAEIQANAVRASRRVAWLEERGREPGRDIRDHARFSDLGQQFSNMREWRPISRASADGDRAYDRRPQARRYLEVRTAPDEGEWMPQRAPRSEADRRGTTERERPGLAARVGGSSGLLEVLETRKSRFRALLEGS